MKFVKISEKFFSTWDDIIMQRKFGNTGIRI